MRDLADRKRRGSGGAGKRVHGVYSRDRRCLVAERGGGVAGCLVPRSSPLLPPAFRRAVSPKRGQRQHKLPLWPLGTGNTAIFSGPGPCVPRATVLPSAQCATVIGAASLVHIFKESGAWAGQKETISFPTVGWARRRATRWTRPFLL